MNKSQKKEAVSIVLYALSGMIVGGVVGGALLMKMMTEGDTRRALAEQAAAQTAETEPPAVTLPEPEIVTEPPVPEPVAEPVVETSPPPDAESLRALLAPAEPLFTAVYCYTESDCYENHSEVWGKKVPFSTDTVVLTCDGTITMRVDTDAIAYAVDPEAMRITVTLPEPEIVSHDLDEDSIRYYDVKSSLFRSPSLADYTALIRDVKAQICDKVLEQRDFGGQTLDTAENIIRSSFAIADATAEYAVTFVLPETETPAVPAATEPLPAETLPAETDAPEDDAGRFSWDEPDEQEHPREPAEPDVPFFSFWW